MATYSLWDQGRGEYRDYTEEELRELAATSREKFDECFRKLRQHVGELYTELLKTSPNTLSLITQSDWNRWFYLVTMCRTLHSLQIKTDEAGINYRSALIGLDHIHDQEEKSE